MTDREIAARMSVSEKTVDTYWARVRQKLDARNRTHAVAIAYRFAYEDRRDPLFGCSEMLGESEEGVWIIDLHGNTIYANKKLADLFGYSKEEMQRLNAWDLLDDEGRAEARRTSEEFPSGRRDTYRFRFKKKDGTDLRVLMTQSPICDEHGNEIRSLVMLNEIPA
jgi:PAS domain S-box-containing protein